MELEWIGGTGLDLQHPPFFSLCVQAIASLTQGKKGRHTKRRHGSCRETPSHSHLRPWPSHGYDKLDDRAVVVAGVVVASTVILVAGVVVAGVLLLVL